MKLKIIDIACHRNGICGAPFDAVLFRDEDGSRKVAILFEQPSNCAVLDVDKLAKGDIAFGSNSWRGDQFEPHLRKAIAGIRNRSDVPMADVPAVRKPAIAVVSVRHGLVESVRTNIPLHFLVEDWDATEIRPAHDPMVPDPMHPREEADLARFFQPSTEQGE